MTKRISALFIAIAMILTGLTALAEPAVVPAPLTAEAVYERGGAIKTEMDVTLNTQFLTDTIANMGGPEKAESTALIVKNVLGAINKLKTTLVQNKTNFSAVIGTEAGQVIDAQGIANLETGEVSFTTNLLPGLKFELPKEMLQEALKSQSQMTALMAGADVEMLNPYVDAVKKAFQDSLAQVTAPQIGTYKVADVGTFKQMAEFDIIQETVAAFLDAINSVFKQDTQMQQMVDKYLQLIATQAEAAAMATEAAPAVTMTPDTPSVKNSADLIAKLDEAVAELRKDSARAIAHQRLYVDGDALFYTEVEPTEKDGAAPMMISVLGNKQEGGFGLSIGIVMDAETPSFSYEPTATPEPTPAPAVKDWSAVKKAIQDESKPMGMLAQIDLLASTDAAAKQSLSKINISLLLPGMFKAMIDPTALGDMSTMPPHFTVSITSDMKSSLDTPYTAEGNFTLSALVDEPLVSVKFKAEETTEAPAALADATTTTVLAETMSEEDQKAIANVLMRGVPALLERLKTALPEEGTALVSIIEQAMQPAPTTPN
jgi:uncharacterized protein YjgD (DUF1641 family)